MIIFSYNLLLNNDEMNKTNRGTTDKAVSIKG